MADTAAPANVIDNANAARHAEGLARVPVSRWTWTLTGTGFAARCRRARPFVPAFAAALIGIALSVFAWNRVSFWEDRQARQEFADVAAHRAQSLQSGVNEYINKLSSL
jgi:hypothetical protein